MLDIFLYVPLEHMNVKATTPHLREGYTHCYVQKYFTSITNNIALAVAHVVKVVVIAITVLNGLAVAPP